MTRSISTAMTVFIVFFGLSLIEAVEYRRWWAAISWLVIAVAFALLGARGKDRIVEH